MNEIVPSPDQTPQTTDTLPAIVDAAPPKHKYTPGRIIFDLLVFAGIGWVLNTGISVAAADQFRNGAWKKIAVKGEQFFNKILTPFLRNEATREEWSKNAFFISTIYSGGTLLVLPMRAIERHQSEWVRKIDNWWHGRNVENEPEFHSAHTAMDHAPQQSFHSLFLARALALPAGLALGPLLGNAHALSTKLLQATPLKNYSSFTRAGLSISRNVASRFFPSLREAALEAKRISPYAELPHESRAIKIGFYAIYDLLLSLVVAAGFYISSKIFAKLFSHAANGAAGEGKNNGNDISMNYLGYVAADNQLNTVKSNNAILPTTIISHANRLEMATLGHNADKETMAR